MPVTAYDVAGSPIVGFDGQNYFARRTVVIAWGDIDSYFQELLPATVGIVQSPGASFSASIPNLRVHSVTASPFYGESDQITNPGSCGSALPTYSEARVVIEYRVPTSPQTSGAASGIDPVPFLEHNASSGGELLNLEQGDGASTGRWYWETDLTYVPAEAPIPKFVGTTQHSVRWPRVKSPNWTNLENFKGSINTSAFTLRGYAYPAEQLLYLNYAFREVVMTDSSSSYDLTLNFVAKSVLVSTGVYGGHNHFWNKDKTRWERVILDTDSTTRPYPRNDFSQLFVSGP